MNPQPMPPSPVDTVPRELGRPLAGWRLRLYTIIFEADTRAGRAFDLILIGFILASVVVVVLDSMSSVHQQHGRWLKGLEWFFTIAFTLEYIARLACVRHPWRYARSFFGIIDLLAILPAYLAMLVPEHARADRRAHAAAAAHVPDAEADRLRQRVRCAVPGIARVATQDLRCSCPSCCW